MLDFIRERSERLHAATANVQCTRRLPLMAEMPLSPGMYDAIVNYTKIYLYDSLQLLGEWCYDLDGDFLNRYRDRISSLPNITPNGLLLPKKHNHLSFNMLYGCVAGITKSFGLGRYAERIHTPISARIVDGTPNPAVDSRPRASTKAHSDIWAGELANHVMVYIPVLGDMENIGVNLYEPGADFFPDYVRPLADYSEGAHLAREENRYDVVMRPGNVYFLDSFLIHQTFKRKPGLRMAINFVFLTPEVPSDLAVTTSRNDQYIRSDVWFKYGRSRLLVANEEARAFSAEEMGQVKNEYAARYADVDI